MSITGKSHDEGTSHWISISDMMTGLMVIFMFIAIAFMVDVIEDNKQQDIILEELKESKKQQDILVEELQKIKKEQDIIFDEFKAVQENLYQELLGQFKSDFQNWNMTLDRDLSIRFTNVDVLFGQGDYHITPRFAAILDEFLPRYFEVLRKRKYRDNIMEIRIEGHSNDDQMVKPGYDTHPYIGNVQLSQERARSVMKHFMLGPYFKRLSNSEQEQLEYWLTANGLSYGQMLNTNGKLVKEFGGVPDKEKSRRVEFRIVTAMEKVIEAMSELAE